MLPCSPRNLMPTLTSANRSNACVRCADAVRSAATSLEPTEPRPHGTYPRGPSGRDLQPPSDHWQRRVPVRRERAAGIGDHARARHGSARAGRDDDPRTISIVGAAKVLQWRSAGVSLQVPVGWRRIVDGVARESCAGTPASAGPCEVQHIWQAGTTRGQASTQQTSCDVGAVCVTLRSFAPSTAFTGETSTSADAPTAGTPAQLHRIWTYALNNQRLAAISSAAAGGVPAPRFLDGGGVTVRGVAGQRASIPRSEPRCRPATSSPPASRRVATAAHEWITTGSFDSSPRRVRCQPRSSTASSVRCRRICRRRPAAETARRRIGGVRQRPGKQPDLRRYVYVCRSRISARRPLACESR